MKDKTEFFHCFRNPMARRWPALALGLGLSCSAVADTTTLGVSDATISSRNVPVTLNFPVTRSGELTYDAVLSYHTVEGSAFSGIDYTAATSSIVIPAGSTSATIPVTIAAHIGGGADQTFQLMLDTASGIGPVPSFASEQAFPTAAYPRWVATADLNGDGKADLIVTSESDNTVSVLLNTTAPGAASPSFAAQQAFASGINTETVTTADINGDGKLDLIVVNLGADTVSVLLNTTSPGAVTASFATQQTFATGSHPFSVVAADVNGDGVPDLTVTNGTSNTVSVLLNTTPSGAASPSFAAQQTFATGSDPLSVTAADINGDGKTDLIVANFNDNTISVLLNTTLPGAVTLSFTAKQDFVADFGGSLSVTAADINGDGKPDVIVTNVFGFSVSVLLNTTMPGATTPSLAAQKSFATGSFPFAVITADLNGDGKPDLIVANDDDGTVSVLLNTTAPGAPVPSFAIQQTFASGLDDVSVTAADLNGDGKPDLVVANNNQNTVSVLLNIIAPPAATSNFATQQPFATGMGSLSATAADINGDGKPDLIVSNFADNTVSVLLDTTAPGAATPTFAAQQAFATDSGPGAVTTADLNGDGKIDLVVANHGADDVSVLFNTTAPGATTPTFATQQSFAAGDGPRSVTATDVNGDGKADLIVANEFANTVSVLVNTTAPGATTPSFAAQQTFVVTNVFSGGPFSVTAADLNGDGRPDLIVANIGAQAADVLLNTTIPGAATASFATHQSFAAGSNPHAVVAAEVNGDGKPDLVVVNDTDNTVSVLLNTTAPGAATPTFAAQQTFATGASPGSVAMADVDGDGKLDMIVANGGFTVSMLLNTTTPGALMPTFAAQQTFSTSTGRDAVIAADLNGDGKPDLIVAGGFGYPISVLLNAQYQGLITGSPATGTITHDAIFSDGFE